MDGLTPIGSAISRELRCFELDLNRLTGEENSNYIRFTEPWSQTSFHRDKLRYDEGDKVAPTFSKLILGESCNSGYRFLRPGSADSSPEPGAGK